MESAEAITGFPLYEVPADILRRDFSKSASQYRDALLEVFNDLDTLVQQTKRDPFPVDPKDRFLGTILQRCNSPVLGVFWPPDMGLVISSLVKIPGGIEKESASFGFVFTGADTEEGAIHRQFRIHEAMVEDTPGIRAAITECGAFHSWELERTFFFLLQNKYRHYINYIRKDLSVCDGIAWRQPDIQYAFDYEEEVAELDKTEAGAKAVELLWDHLTPEQRRSWIKTRSFVVTKTGPPPPSWRRSVLRKRKRYAQHHEDRLWSCLEGRKYVFDGNTTCGTVNAFTYDGQFLFNACIHPGTVFPTGDALLAMKLQLDEHEGKFLRKANLTFAGNLVELKKLRLCI